MNPDKFYDSIVNLGTSNHWDIMLGRLPEFLKNKARFTTRAKEALLSFFAQSAHKAGEKQLAKTLLEEAIQIAPNRIDLKTALSQVCIETDDLERAEVYIRDAIQLNPEDPSELVITLSLEILFGLGKVREASSFVDRHAIAIRKSPKALGIASSIKQAMGSWAETIACLRLAEQIDPTDLHVQYLLAGHFIDKTWYDEAEKTIDKLLLREPENPLFIAALGMLRSKMGYQREGIKLMEAALDIQSFPFIHHNLACLYSQEGDKEQSTKHLMSSANGSTGRMRAPSLAMLSDNVSATPDSPIAAELTEILTDSRQAPENWTHASFALARIYHRGKDYPKAFAFFKKGNRIQRGNFHYNIEQDEKRIRFFSEIIEPAAKVKVSRSNVSHVPIFILGMPRSGTTLIESLVGKVSTVDQLGELEFSGQIIRNQIKQNQDLTSEHNLALFREIYFRRVRAILPDESGSTHFTDKMPLNFMHVPLILASIPEAKVIHTVRQPIATCWSNFRHFFPADGNAFGCDLKDVAIFYNLYSEYMDRVERRFPDRIFRLSYENFIDDPEKIGESMFNYLGLAWDPSLIRKPTTGAIKTASQDQVRKPIYTGSNDGWKHYEQFIIPMIDILTQRGAFCER